MAAVTTGSETAILPALAGLAFACLTVKPQLAFLIPVLLAFDRNWLALLCSAVFTTALLVLSVLFFGLDSWGAYLCWPRGAPAALPQRPHETPASAPMRS
jgi:hypothetical protein